LATNRLDVDLRALERLRGAGGTDSDVSAAQVRYLRDEGFRFAAFGGSGKGYAARVRALRQAILGWFADRRRRRRLRAATGGRTDVLNQLWRNYQANYAEEAHMAALAQDSHFASVLESLPVVGPLAGSAPKRPPAPAPSPPATPIAPARHDPKRREPTADGSGPAAHAGPATTPIADHTDPRRHAQEEHRHEPPTAAKTAHQGGAEPSADAGAQRPFRREHFSMSNRQKLLIPKSGHKRAISKPPSIYTAEILAMSTVPNPETWYDDFTSGVRFLGRRLRHPIHIVLAEHLRKVERELAEKYGGPDKDPVLAGKALGLDEDIIGARSYPTSAAISMHMFGLALDINYTHNPFISGSANEVFARAGQLIHGHKAAWEANMSYGQLSALNKTLTDYFKLARDRAGLAERLKAATGVWKGMDVDAAQKLIEADLSEEPVKADKKHRIEGKPGGLAWRWARGDQIDVIRETGFINVTQDLVRGLKMNWGAAYGDNMHFDLRTDGGKGAAIFDAIGRYVKKLKAEADQAEQPPAVPAP
jgi:hypothetical protein